MPNSTKKKTVKLTPFTPDEVSRRLWEIAVSRPVNDLAVEMKERGVTWDPLTPITDIVDRNIPSPLLNKMWNTTPDLARVARVSFVHLVRFDSDEFVEEWVVDKVMKTSLSVVEVVAEVDQALTGVLDFADGVPG